MTRICNEIIRYENAVWNYLTDVFRFELKAAELGFTNDLVFRITKFYNGRPQSCEVYIFNDNVNENIRGADIDLFIEDGNTGLYYFYMLQAKIMNWQGRFRDIKRWSRNAQYLTLLRAARIESAMPLYLFYNGKTLNSTLGRPEYGLSIIDAEEIRALRASQRSNPSAPMVTFNQLIPRGMLPFDSLFCYSDQPPYCDIQSNRIPYEKIYRGYPYKKINITNTDTGDVKTDTNNNISSDNQNEKYISRNRIIISSFKHK